MLQTNFRRWFAGFVSLLIPSAVLACTCGLKTTSDRVSLATDIFIARVTQAREIHVPEAPSASREQVEARYVVLRRLKGASPNEGVLRGGVYNGGLNCAFELMPGNQYVFFLFTDTFVSGCGGSRLFFPWDSEHQKYLQDIEKMLSGR